MPQLVLLALGVTLAVELFNQKVFTQGGTGLWDFLTGAPLAFAVDMLLVLVTLVPALFLRRQAFWCTLLSAVWLSLGAVNGFILVNRQTPFTVAEQGDDVWVKTSQVGVRVSKSTGQVRFTDYHSPRFGLAEPLVFAESTTNNTEVRALFSASDVLDGDLTDWITYVETNAAYNNPGDYTITMEVRNSFGDTVSYAFPIHIYERNTQDFDITLTEPLVYVEQGSGFDPLSYVESVRDLSGNRYDPALLNVTSNVDTSAPGIYEIHYEIGNAFSSGDDEEEEEHAPEENEESGEEETLRTEIEEESQYGQMWLTVIVQEVAA